MAAKPSSMLGGGGGGVILEIKQFVVFGETLPLNRIPTGWACVAWRVSLAPKTPFPFLSFQTPVTQAIFLQRHNFL